MNRFHSHHSGGSAKHQQICYHCGREFLHPGMLNRLKKRRHHCPACHFDLRLNYGSNNNEESPGHSEQSCHGSRIAHFSKSLMLSLRHSKKKIRAEQSSECDAAINTTRCTSNSLDLDESNVDIDVDNDSLHDRRKRYTENKKESCPFAFTYETEDVESYQVSHEGTHDNDDVGVEGYQMEWLLFNVP